MLILLPPSEGKAVPARRGKPVQLDTLSVPELTAARRKVLEALIETSERPDAAEILGLSAGQLGELELNRRLLENPARAAGSIYTGVLYDALGLDTLAGKRRAAASIRIQSALWGPIKITDRIPPYRLSIGTNLPGVGGLAGFWREQLAGVLDVGPKLIIDCRSGPYAAAWRPDHTEKLIKVGAVTEVGGTRRVVSHFAKHTRGIVARILLEASRVPRTPDQVAAIVGEHLNCELTGPTRDGWDLTVVTGSGG